MPKFVARLPGIFFRMPGTVNPVGTMTISVDSDPLGTESPIGTMTMSVDTAIEADLFNDHPVTRAAVDFDMAGSVALVGSMSVSTPGVDTGFPYTFPITFGGGGAAAPETDVGIVGAVALEGQLETEIEFGITGQVELLGNIDFEPVSGFPYTFPITL